MLRSVVRHRFACNLSEHADGDAGGRRGTGGRDPYAAAPAAHPMARGTETHASAPQRLVRLTYMVLAYIVMAYAWMVYIAVADIIMAVIVMA